jgi:hypothetical protein
VNIDNLGHLIRELARRDATRVCMAVAGNQLDVDDAFDLCRSRNVT